MTQVLVLDRRVAPELLLLECAQFYGRVGSDGSVPRRVANGSVDETDDVVKYWNEVEEGSDI